MLITLVAGVVVLVVVLFVLARWARGAWQPTEGHVQAAHQKLSVSCADMQARR